MHTQTNDSSQHQIRNLIQKVIFKRKATRSRNLHSFIPIESTRYATNYISSFQGTKDNLIFETFAAKKKFSKPRVARFWQKKKKKNILLPWLIVQNVSPIAIVKAGATLQQLWMESDGY